MAIIINDNRVCPMCGGYSQNYGDGYCTNEHFVEDKDWVKDGEAIADIKTIKTKKNIAGIPVGITIDVEYADLRGEDNIADFVIETKNSVVDDLGHVCIYDESKTTKISWIFDCEYEIVAKNNYTV